MGDRSDFPESAYWARSLDLIEETSVIQLYEGKLRNYHGNNRVFTLTTDADEELRDEFLHAANNWENISSHENIVPVLEYGESPQPWIAVEQPTGERLADVESIPVRHQRAVITDIATALRTAGRYNIHHLALKPSNVVVTTSDDGATAQVDNWGVGRLIQKHEDTPTLTPFTPPEVLSQTHSSGEHSDVYALGALSYYLFTEYPPVNTDDLQHAICNGEIVPPETRNVSITDATQDVILRALETDPDARYNSVYSFQSAIARTLPDRSASDVDSERQERDAAPATSDEHNSASNEPIGTETKDRDSHTEDSETVSSESGTHERTIRDTAVLALLSGLGLSLIWYPLLYLANATFSSSIAPSVIALAGSVFIFGSGYVLIDDARSLGQLGEYIFVLTVLSTGFILASKVAAICTEMTLSLSTPALPMAILALSHIGSYLTVYQYQHSVFT